MDVLLMMIVIPLIVASAVGMGQLLMDAFLRLLQLGIPVVRQKQRELRF